LHQKKQVFTAAAVCLRIILSIFQSTVRTPETLQM